MNNNGIKFSLNLEAYPLEAIYGAAYVFIDKAYLFLDNPSSKKIEVFLKSKTQKSKKQLENLKGEFLNELLNYTLRVNLNKRNRKIREYIVNQALFSAVKQEEIKQEDKLGYQDDPLGIAVPWEEKYGKKNSD
jgi:His-Xaa-Ser system protein HxsD